MSALEAADPIGRATSAAARPPGLDDDLAFAIALAARAGEVLMDRYERLERIDYKSARDVVTEADHQSEALILDAIRERHPTDAILAEETGEHQAVAGEAPLSGRGRVWIVDPLDGTVNYANGIPFFCVSIALIVDGQPSVGVIHDPTRNETFAATTLTNFAVTLAIAAVIGGVIGYGVSRALLRFRYEWFLALVLLVGGEIVRIVVRGYEPVICASNGLSGVAQPFVWVGNPQSASILFAGLILILVAAAYVYSERLLRSPYGRLLKAVRENDAVAQSLGKNVARVRAQVMFIGSAMAAVAGVLFAVNVGFVTANDYVVTLTLDVWVMIVLGGLGNNKGALLGALLITVLDRVTAVIAIQANMLGSEFEFNYARYILFGVLLLLMLRYRPQGLLPEPKQTTPAHEVLSNMSDAEATV